MRNVRSSNPIAGDVVVVKCQYGETIESCKPWNLGRQSGGLAIFYTLSKWLCLYERSVYRRMDVEFRPQVYEPMKIASADATHGRALVKLMRLSSRQNT